MERTVLCLSCLNGEIKAAVSQRGSITDFWERPAPLDDFANFTPVALEAAEKTKYSGEPVAIVLSHARLSDQLTEVPPVKGWKLERFLRRRVEQLKTFDGEAAWSYQRAMRTKNSEATLLHLLPKALLDQLTAGCDKADLRLVRVLPTTAVLAHQLKELPLEKDEVALLAAETGPTTSVVIGHRDGRVCLGRVLTETWNTRPDRVAVDLTRTIGFAEQQTGLGVSSVWIFGAGARERLQEIQAALKLPVKVSPVEWKPSYWAQQAARIPEKEDGNLISYEQRQAPMQRRLLTATGLVLLLLFLAAAGAAGVLEVMRGKEQKSLDQQTANMVRMQEEKSEWDRRHRELDRKQRFVEKVTDEKPEPVPAWFLGYLGDAVPEDLLLTELHVKGTNDAWSIRLAGVAQPTTNPAPEIIFSRALIALTNNLTTGPFHLNITRRLPEDMAASLTNVASPTEMSFEFEGFIR